MARSDLQHMIVNLDTGEVTMDPEDEDLSEFLVDDCPLCTMLREEMEKKENSGDDNDPAA